MCNLEIPPGPVHFSGLKIPADSWGKFLANTTQWPAIAIPSKGNGQSPWIRIEFEGVVRKTKKKKEKNTNGTNKQAKPFLVTTNKQTKQTNKQTSKQTNKQSRF